MAMVQAPGAERGLVLQVFRLGGRCARGVGIAAGGLDLLGRERRDPAPATSDSHVLARQGPVTTAVRVLVATAHQCSAPLRGPPEIAVFQQRPVET